MIATIQVLISPPGLGLPLLEANLMARGINKLSNSLARDAEFSPPAPTDRTVSGPWQWSRPVTRPCLGPGCGHGPWHRDRTVTGPVTVTGLIGQGRRKQPPQRQRRRRRHPRERSPIDNVKLLCESWWVQTLGTLSGKLTDSPSRRPPPSAIPGTLTPIR